jgi:hypothetical protein
MKSLSKLACATLMAAGAAFAFTAPADARISVGIGIGAPVYGPDCPQVDFDPYCDYGYYDGPVFINGIWLGSGHYRHRYWGGHHQFWYNGGWHNGGWGRNGRWGGHGGWSGHSGHRGGHHGHRGHRGH